MARSLSSRLLHAILHPALLQTCRNSSKRLFHFSSVTNTDGVYKTLTDMWIYTPWIEALRRSRGEGDGFSSDPIGDIKPDLIPKKMSDSFVKFVLPLAQDPWLLDTYSNSSGQIRLGALLMDLDALSSVVAYKHTGEGVTTVTAAVDRINITNPLTEICDLEMSGQVTYATGRSSMEINLQVAKALSTTSTAPDPSSVFMTCAFTMVSLDPSTKRPVSIAPLEITTPSERALYARGEANQAAKNSLRAANILSLPPDAEESKLIHQMWASSLAYADSSNPATRPANMMPMSSAILRSTQIMQPQYRNRHNFMIFGGHLLRQTFELAFTCAASFSHTRPRFLNLDPSTFEQPVPVGSVLYLSAGVIYTDLEASGSGTRVQVMVRTSVCEVEHCEYQKKQAGTFFYTFHVDAHVSVLPQSYGEFMRWVGGRRRAKRLSEAMEKEKLVARGAGQVLGQQQTTE